MPTYDYSCDACKHEFEVFEPITAQPQKKCPKCKKNKLRRLFGAGGGLIFKGSGFYQQTIAQSLTRRPRKRTNLRQTLIPQKTPQRTSPKRNQFPLSPNQSPNPNQQNIGVSLFISFLRLCASASLR